MERRRVVDPVAEESDDVAAGLEVWTKFSTTLSTTMRAISAALKTSPSAAEMPLATRRMSARGLPSKPRRSVPR
jgi:hypothetical protein